ncbi:MAG: adenylate/guanylate cyclase domain-containing protein [Cenarchaeum sp. SB0678_bin_8]|nr:adenylate/guanylate cyclase domain-containing protein [Cenarchaeum sp. SB0666_bin_15]MYD58110.1 adenylate/guanylate cyclase domain-containing protein [Cenarchaeum sp. SB0678_bin_8]MYJ28199.1 adenylate/guanylate cyclase domain-containing protein [Cenarchaeum sp. SB0672_bin_9]
MRLGCNHNNTIKIPQPDHSRKRPMTKIDPFDISDMILTKPGTIVDSETLLRNTQTRIWASLKKDYRYKGVPDNSTKFLRQNVFKKFNAVVLYVDLVGSTEIALGLPYEKLAIIMGAFAQEMASTVDHHGGLLLKFMGDAIIAYFVPSKRVHFTADQAVRCAKSMSLVISEGINPILSQYDYPELHVRMGMDYGTNIVVRYGSDPKLSHVDLMGRSMNMASKIQSVANADQLLVGEDVYKLLHPRLQEEFEIVVWKDINWKYRSLDTGNLYKVYALK